jgi:ethanolamine utilization protein EutQ (cupin superfamily)
MALTSAVINTTNTVVFSSVGTNAVTTMVVCNTTDTTDAVLTLHLVADGDTASVANKIINKLPITAMETLSLDQEKIILEGGDSIVAVTDQADTLSVTISTLGV